METPMVVTNTNDKRIALIPGGFGAGVGAAVVMMLVMAVLRLISNTITIPELMEERLIHLAGGKVESFFINTLGVGGKALLLVTIVEGTLLLGGLLGLAFTRLWATRGAMASNRWLSGLLYGLVVGLLLNAVFLPIAGQGFFGSDALEATAPPDISNALYGRSLAPFGLPVWFNMFLLGVVFGLTLAKLLPWPRTSTIETTPEAMPAPKSMSRRDFAKGVVGALVGGVALWFGVKSLLAPPHVAAVQVAENDNAPQPQPTPEGTAMAQAEPTNAASFEGVKPMLVPEVTPVDTFYITTKNYIDPTVDGKSWKLDFKGMVDSPYSINLADLQAMPSMDRIETLACISNSVGGSLIGNARWKGVDFAQMLKKAKPQAGAVDVVVRAADGYADSFPISAALNNECVLVYEMNGAPLTQKHGYPARLLVPGIYGMKNCKWLTSVELVNYDFKGYWESQGWNDVAHYQTMSRIDYPDTDRIDAKPIYIGGVAFAGDRGIKRVEVSTDGGGTWHDAQLRPPMGKYTWTLWTYPWLPKAGAYTLKVRATDGKGAVQTADEQDTYPDGATGYHTVQVRVG